MFFSFCINNCWLTSCSEPQDRQQFCGTKGQLPVSLTRTHPRSRGGGGGERQQSKELGLCAKEKPQEVEQPVKRRRRLKQLGQAGQSQAGPGRRPEGPRLPANHAAARRRGSKPLQTTTTHSQQSEIKHEQKESKIIIIIIIISKNTVVKLISKMLISEF